MALNEELRRALGDRLAELRGPMPQRKVADAVGVTDRTYGAWERGESGIQWEHLEDVASFFKVSTNFLLYGSETPPHNVGSQLDRIEETLSDLDEQLRLLRVETEAGVAEVLKRLGGEPPPTRRSRKPQRP